MYDSVIVEMTDTLENLFHNPGQLIVSECLDPD